jgi:hypothetical protein
MRRAEPVAGLGGLLLLVALFLPWYGADLPPSVGDLQPFGPEDMTGWQALTVIDVVLALIALVAIAVPVISATTRGPAKPVAIEVIASAIGWLAVLLVAIRLVFPPDDLSVRYGVWLALAGAVIAWVGSWMSMRDESTPGAVPPDVPRRAAPPTAAA